MKKQKKKNDTMCASHRQERGHPACVNQNPAEDSSASFLPLPFSSAPAHSSKIESKNS